MYRKKHHTNVQFQAVNMLKFSIQIKKRRQQTRPKKVASHFKNVDNGYWRTRKQFTVETQIICAKKIQIKTINIQTVSKSKSMGMECGI